MADQVNHPSHYNQGKIEVIEFIEDQDLGFHLGNVVKYVSRAQHKGKPVEDLQKAQWYLQRALAVLAGNPPRPNDMPIPSIGLYQMCPVCECQEAAVFTEKEWVCEQCNRRGPVMPRQTGETTC